MRIAGVICCLILGLMTAGAMAAPGKRVALVIGQGDYRELVSLPNPVSDARSVADILKNAGFEVMSCDGKTEGCFNLSRTALIKALDELKAKAAGADLALVFFAGHGVASDEGNILTPTDADIDCKTGAITRGVAVEMLMQAVTPAKQKFLILDACRDNPIGEICPGLKGKKLSFARIEAGALQNFLLVTSTQFGQTAQDGPAGTHSPFATALLDALKANPHVYFEQVMNEVARATYDAAQKQLGFLQIPGKVVGGAAPADCLAGKDCVGDPRMASLAVENEQLSADASGVRSLLADEERARGKPYTLEERKARVAQLQSTLTSIGKSNDPLRQEARRLIDAGDVSAGQTKLDEALDADEKALAEVERLESERRKTAARNAADLAELARGKDVLKALSYYRRAVKLAPRDAETWRKYADVALLGGYFTEAGEAYNSIISLGATADDRNLYWARLGLGDVKVARGNLSEALMLYQQAEADADRLAKLDANNTQWQRDLSASYDRIGDVLVAQGNLAEALKSFRQGLSIAQKLADLDPNNTGWQRDLSVSYNKVGDVLVAQGNLPEALKAFRDSLTIRDRLAKADPNNAGWQRDLVVSYTRLITIYERQGEIAKAKDLLAAGKLIMERLTKLSPTNAAWKKDLGWFEAQIADLPNLQTKVAIQAAFDAKDYAKAADLQAKLARAIEKAEREKIGKAGPQTASALLSVSWYQLFARDFKGALASTDRAIALAPDQPIYATNKAHALMFLDRAREARGLYVKYKGKPVQQGGVMWEQGILDDFKELKKRGLKHKQMAEIEALLAAKQ